MAILAEDKPQKTGDIGGQPKQKYWTPDGRVIMAQPDMHVFAQTDSVGKVVKEGMRDAHLDKGWLLQPPVVKSLYCPHCDRWHRTKTEINDCLEQKKEFDAHWARQAKKDGRLVDTADDRIAALENDMRDIKTLLERLLEQKEVP